MWAAYLELLLVDVRVCYLAELKAVNLVEKTADLTVDWKAELWAIGLVD